MEAAVCTHCCAPLPPPVGRGSTCRYCGTFHSVSAPGDAPARVEVRRHDVIAMTDAAVLDLLRRHFTDVESAWLSPSIPAKKERTARRVHAAHLPPDEPILLLFDDTVFGSAEEGFVITARRLCWKNITEPPGMLEWARIDPAEIDWNDKSLRVRSARLEALAKPEPNLLAASIKVFPVLAASARSQGAPR